MKHFISSQDLLQFLYEEVDYLKKMAIEKALQEDPELREEWEALLSSYQLLQAEHFQEVLPDELAIQNILAYSQNSLTAL
jgi:uncharacterized membrane protein YkgB